MSEFKTFIESRQNALGRWSVRTIQVRETAKLFFGQDGRRFKKMTDETLISKGIVGIRTNDSSHFHENIFLSQLDTEHSNEVLKEVEKDRLILNVKFALQNVKLTFENAVRLKEVLVELGFME